MALHLHRVAATRRLPCSTTVSNAMRTEELEAVRVRS